MPEVLTTEISHDFLSSAHIFSTAMRDVFEEAVLEEVAGDSLSVSQFKLLYLVAHTEHHTIGDAAAFLGVSNAAASKAVDKLVRRRLLRRAEIEGDRRSSQLSLTEESRRLIKAYETARHQKALRVFNRFSVQELQRTAELLDRLAALIIGHSSKAAEVCLQCEFYFRDDCRFGELGRRTCFYQRHKGDKQDQLAAPARNPD